MNYLIMCQEQGRCAVTHTFGKNLTVDPEGISIHLACGGVPIPPGGAWWGRGHRDHLDLLAITVR